MSDMFSHLEKVGYRFQDIQLLEQAFSHRSYTRVHNERLEFLGDSILNCIISEAFYRRYPDAKEGELSRMRSNLVNQKTLAKLAHQFSFQDFVKVGEGERKTGAYQRDSLLSDVFESVIAAIYLDSDFETVQRIVLSWFSDLLQQALSTQLTKDPKSQLQELTQSKKMALPEYLLEKSVGDPHSKVFHVTCTIKNTKYRSKGEGKSRRVAEQIAAQKFLEWLTHDKS